MLAETSGDIVPDVDTFRIESGIGKATLHWSIKDSEDILGFEVTARGLTTTYKKPPVISKEVRMFTWEKIEPLDYVSFRLRVVGKNETRSKGKVEKMFIKHKNVVFDEFSNKKMFIYLPDGYNESTEKYPVMYMLDGQNLFSTAYVNTEWKIDETLDRLVKDGKIKKTIVVGLFHAGDKRTEEYTAYESQMGRDFAEKLCKEFIPYIEGKYKVLEGRENRGIMGSSRGGLTALYMINNYSEYFSFGAGVSPSEKWKYAEYKTFPKKDVKIWIDNGTSDYVLGYARTEACRTMVEGYIAQGHIYGSDLIYYEVKDSIHNELDWASRAEYPFILFTGTKEQKLKDFKIEIEVFHNNEGKACFAANPVGEFDNGIKYSLFNLPKYGITGNAKIDTKGIFDLNGESNVTITVEYLGQKKEIITSEKELENMRIVNAGMR